MPKKIEKERPLRVVLTGGHAATTAIATVQEIQKRNLPWELYWIGPKHAIEGKKTLTSAYKNLPRFGVYYLALTTGRLQRRWSRYTLPSLFKIPVGFLHSFYLLLKVRPHLVVSYGGYAAFPVVVVAWAFRIPVVVHSQTVAIGISNKMSTLFAKYLALARMPEGLGNLSKKSRLVGNPVMTEILNIREKSEMPKTPTVLITGGSTGSQSINNALLEVLPTMLENFNVIHQTGDLDYQKFESLKATLPTSLAAKYEVFAFSDKLSQFFEKSDIVVSRAGANTISEILLIRRPAILVPHPWVNLDEQNKNAKLVSGISRIQVLPQEKLSGKTLLDFVGSAIKNFKNTKGGLETEFEKLDRTASQTFVDLLASCVK